MRFENYLNDNLNSEFNDVKNGDSSYKCGEIPVDYSKFKENHTKYKVRISNEEKKFDSLVTEINVNRLKKLEEEKNKAKEQREKEEYERANAEQIRINNFIKYNKRKEKSFKFIRACAVLLLVTAFVLYIIHHLLTEIHFHSSFQSHTSLLLRLHLLQSQRNQSRLH